MTYLVMGSISIPYQYCFVYRISKVLILLAKVDLSIRYALHMICTVMQYVLYKTSGNTSSRFNHDLILDSSDIRATLPTSCIVPLSLEVCSRSMNG